MTPTCPRCGYDLSGVAKTWTDRCPLRGTCSECGLEYQWADVLRPDRQRLPGYFEHARGLAPVCFFRTLLWSIRPKRFWQRVGLHHTVMPRRLLLFAMLVFAPLYALIGGLNTFALVASPSRRFSMTTDWLDLVSCWSYPVFALRTYGTRQVYFEWTVDELPDYASCALVISSLFPVLLWLMPSTRRSIKVRGSHVWRAAVHGLGWLVPAMLLFTISAVLWSLGALLGRRYYTASWRFMQVVQVMDWGILGVATAWQLRWWYCAMRWGMRFPNPGRHFAVLAVPAFLVIALFVLGSTRFWYFLGR